MPASQTPNNSDRIPLDVLAAMPDPEEAPEPRRRRAPRLTKHIPRQVAPEPAVSDNMPVLPGNAAILTPACYIRTGRMLRRKYQAWRFPEAEEQIEAQIEDALQNTFLSLAETHDVVRNPVSFVNKLACRRVVDERRQDQAERAARLRLQTHLLHTGEAAKQTATNPETGEQESAAEPIAPPENIVGYLCLKAWLDSLSPRDRNLIWRHIYDQEPFATIDRRLRKAAGWASKRFELLMGRARAKPWYLSFADFASLRAALALRTAMSGAVERVSVRVVHAPDHLTLTG